MELAHGRDRNHPLCSWRTGRSTSTSRPGTRRDDFAAVGVDAYLGELLAEMYLGGRIEAGKVVLSLPWQQGICTPALRPLPVDLLLPRAQGPRRHAAGQGVPSRDHPPPLAPRKTARRPGRLASSCSLDDGQGPPVHPYAGPGHIVVLHQQLHRHRQMGASPFPRPAASLPAPAGATRRRVRRETGWAQALWC